MKVISREKIGSTKLQENLDSEISIMRDYRHENIVLLYDHFVSDFTSLLIISHPFLPVLSSSYLSCVGILRRRGPAEVHQEARKAQRNCHKEIFISTW
jgi:serine/threonine protein kinase